MKVKSLSHVQLPATPWTAAYQAPPLPSIFFIKVETFKADSSPEFHALLTVIFHFHALEKEMATHSSVLAWRIPGTGEPGGLLSMKSHRVGHD